MNNDMKAAGLTGCGLVLFICLCFGGCYVGSRVQVSDGTRDGTIRKISDTGVLFTTTEIEMVDYDRFAASPATYAYSVKDPAVAEKIRALKPGQKIRLHYRKVLSKWAPNGESHYFVTDVQPLE